jgi:hypothetical protein
MLILIHLIGTFIANLFKTRCRLEAENLFLRHQLNIVLRCGAPPGLRLRGSNRALLVWMTRLWPSLPSLSRVVQPNTILRCHRAAFRAYWRRKSVADRAGPGLLASCACFQQMSREKRPAYPWRTAEARVRDRRVDGLQIHDQATRATIANLADIPA